MRRFPCEALKSPGERIQLDEQSSHHVLVVTLVPRGTPLVLFDGHGREAEGVLVDVHEGRAVVEQTSSAREVRASTPVHVVLLLPRKPAIERVLRMATELGMTDFHPVIGRHSVARAAHLDRWNKLVQQAARQCGRGDLPTLHPLAPLDRVLAKVQVPHRLVCAPGTASGAPSEEGVAVLVGPEGGLHPDELEQALEAGWSPVGLGPWVLRADTAVVAALSRYGPLSVM